MKRETVDLYITAYEEIKSPTDELTALKTGKWVGVVILDGDALVWSSPAPTEDKAIRRAKTAFYTALRCEHRMKYDHDTIIQDAMGNDNDVNVYMCEKCGMVEYTEVTHDD